MENLDHYRVLAGSRLREITLIWGSTPAPKSDAIISQLYRQINGLPDLPDGEDPYRGFFQDKLDLAHSRKIIGTGIRDGLTKLKDTPNRDLDLAVDAVLRFVSGLPQRPKNTDPYIRLFPPPVLEDNNNWDPYRATEGVATRLTAAHYAAAAEQYRIPVVDLKAFAEIESNGGGFLPDGRMKILFEGQWFWWHLQQLNLKPEHLQHRFPTIVYPRWTRKHYVGGAREWDRLAVAQGIHETAALKSASWGMFQLMGFNAEVGGYPTVQAMLADYQKGEDRQLLSILQFMEKKGINRALRSGNYRQAITLYNGSGQVDHYLNLFLKAKKRHGG